MFGGRRPQSFAHFPLLHDEEGERLAKRHGSMGIASLRAAGASPEALTGLLATKAGLAERGERLSPSLLLERIRRAGGQNFLWRALRQARKAAPLRILPEDLCGLS